MRRAAAWRAPRPARPPVRLPRRRVMSEGRVEEALSWLRQMEEDAGVAPAWEVFFQAMCCPVPQVRVFPCGCCRLLARCSAGAALLRAARPPVRAPLTPAPPAQLPPAQELKAALDEAIAALARRADLAAALWERLLAAVVVQPASGEAAAVPRYDLSYQLNEIEVGGGGQFVLVWGAPPVVGAACRVPLPSQRRRCVPLLSVDQRPDQLVNAAPPQARAEDYSEAVAFVRLLNALWRAGGGAAAPDGGRAVAHLTKFVRDELLGTAFQVG